MHAFFAFCQKLLGDTFFVRNFLKEVSDTFKNFCGRVYINYGGVLVRSPIVFWLDLKRQCALSVELLPRPFGSHHPKRADGNASLQGQAQRSDANAMNDSPVDCQNVSVTEPQRDPPRPYPLRELICEWKRPACGGARKLSIIEILRNGIILFIEDIHCC